MLKSGSRCSPTRSSSVASLYLGRDVGKQVCWLLQGWGCSCSPIIAACLSRGLVSGSLSRLKRGLPVGADRGQAKRGAVEGIGTFCVEWGLGPKLRVHGHVRLWMLERLSCHGSKWVQKRRVDSAVPTYRLWIQSPPDAFDKMSPQPQKPMPRMHVRLRSYAFVWRSDAEVQSCQVLRGMRQVKFWCWWHSRSTDDHAETGACHGAQTKRQCGE